MELNKRNGQVYCIRWNDGCYIGGTTGSAVTRWGQHLQLLRKGKHTNTTLQSTYTLKGLTAFSFYILQAYLTEEELSQAEYDWTKKLNGCNLLPFKFILDERKRRVLQALQEGKSYRTVAKECKVSLGTVSHYKHTYEHTNN